jgi:hypothetical protein
VARRVATNAHASQAGGRAGPRSLGAPDVTMNGGVRCGGAPPCFFLNYQDFSAPTEYFRTLERVGGTLAHWHGHAPLHFDRRLPNRMRVSAATLPADRRRGLAQSATQSRESGNEASRRTLGAPPFPAGQSLQLRRRHHRRHQPRRHPHLHLLRWFQLPRGCRLQERPLHHRRG